MKNDKNSVINLFLDENENSSKTLKEIVETIDSNLLKMNKELIEKENYNKLSRINPFRQGFGDLKKEIEKIESKKYSILLKHNKKLCSLQRMISNAFNCETNVYGNKDLAHLYFKELSEIPKRNYFDFFHQENEYDFFKFDERYGIYELFLDHDHEIGLGLFYNLKKNKQYKLFNFHFSNSIYYLIYIKKGYIYLKSITHEELKKVNHYFTEIKKQLNNPTGLIRLYAELFEDFELKFLSEEEKDLFLKRQDEMKELILEKNNKAEKLKNYYQNILESKLKQHSQKIDLLKDEIKKIENQIEDLKEDKKLMFEKFYDENKELFNGYFELNLKTK